MTISYHVALLYLLCWCRISGQGRLLARNGEIRHLNENRDLVGVGRREKHALAIYFSLPLVGVLAEDGDGSTFAERERVRWRNEIADDADERDDLRAVRVGAHASGVGACKQCTQGKCSP